MSRSITYLLAAASLGGAFALAGPASANPLPPVPTVTVTNNNGGVQVGAGSPGQPIIGATYDERGVCFGVSLQTTHCVPVTVQGP